MMLLLRANHLCMLKAIILFSGMFIMNHRCEDSGKNISQPARKTLFIRDKLCTGEDDVSTDVLYEEKGVKHCFMQDKGDCCNAEFDFKLKISITNGTYKVATKGPLSKQDIVVLTEIPPAPCNATNPNNPGGFLRALHNCFNSSVQNYRLTDKKEPVQFKQPSSNNACNNGNRDIITKKNRCEFQPDISLTLNSSETISSEQAVKLLENVWSMVEQMGNSSSAVLTVGNVKGILSRLSSKNQTKMSFSRGAFGDLSIVRGNSSLRTDFSQTIEIPKEASTMALERNSSIAAVMFIPWMQQDNSSNTFLQNQVVGIEMGGRIANLSEPIRIQFNGVQKNGSSLSCRSWDGEGVVPVWATDGCETRETSSSVTCLCSHLSFFAILMSPASAQLSASDLKSLTYITSTGCSLSLFFQVVALFMHYLIRKQKSSLEIRILIQLFIAMFIMNLSFLMNETIAGLKNEAGCVATAAVMHYSLLATFTWFFMQAVHLYFNLWRTHSEIKHYMKKICIAGWVTPGVAVSVLLALQKYELLHINTNGVTVDMCWITDAAVHEGVNIGYYAVVFIFTFSIFIIIVRQISMHSSPVQSNLHKRLTKMKIFSILALSVLFGLTWGSAFFSHGPLMVPFYYIFTILNSFQGFFLFIYYYKSSRMFGDNINPSSSISSNSSTTETIENVYANQSAKPTWSSK